MGCTALRGAGEEAPRKPRRLHRRWQSGRVAQVHHARYMLQNTALEIFFRDRSSMFMDFGTKVGSRQSESPRASVGQRGERRR